jgi:hypothetical protein
MTVEDELNAAQMQYLALLRNAGCKFVFKTELFGKMYVWMKDQYGTIFLERIPDDA